MAFYPPDVHLTGLDPSLEMLAIATDVATRLGRSIDLDESDAHQVSYPDGTGLLLQDDSLG